MATRKLPLCVLGYESTPHSAFAFGACADSAYRTLFKVFSGQSSVSLAAVRFAMFDALSIDSFRCLGCLKVYEGDACMSHLLHVLTHEMFLPHSFLVDDVPLVLSMVTVLSYPDPFHPVTDVMVGVFSRPCATFDSPCAVLARRSLESMFVNRSYVYSHEIVCVFSSGNQRCKACSCQFMRADALSLHVLYAMCHADSQGFALDVFVARKETYELIIRRRKVPVNSTV